MIETRWLIDSKDILHDAYIGEPQDVSDIAYRHVGIETVCGLPALGMRRISAIEGFYIDGYCKDCARIRAIAARLSG